MRHLPVFLILVTASWQIRSQSDFILNHIGIEQGLPYHRIEGLTQDMLGFLWIATEIGAIRYDGLNFKLYSSGPEEQNSQNPGSIHGMTIDSSGEIWVGSYALHGYDRDVDHFRYYVPDSVPSNWHILALYGDNNGNIWIGTAERGLFRFDVQQKQFTAINQEINPNMPEGAVTKIIGDRHENLWFSDINGLYRFDWKSNDIKYFPLREKLASGYNDGVVKSLYLDSRGLLWIGTLDGVYLVEATNEGPFKVWDSFSEINCLGEPRDGQIWAVSIGSCYLINRDSSQNLEFSIQQKVIFELEDQNITTFYQGPSGDFWIGTMNNGIYHTSEQFKAFKTYQRIFDRRVYDVSFAEQNDGQIMIGTGSGIVLFEPITDRFSQAPVLSDLHGGTMSQHPDGWIWVASWLGLYKFHSITKKVVEYISNPKNPNSIQGVSVPAILIDRKGTVWVGVWDKGLYRYRPETDDFEHHSLLDSSTGNPHTFIWCLYEDKLGNIWVGNIGGVVKLRPNQDLESFFEFNAFSFYEDTQGRLWIGSGQGLISVNLISGEIEKWNASDGLPDDWVWSVLGDDQGFLWLGTNNGLSKFNPETEEFINFDMDDGLPGNRVGSISLKSRSGELYFSFRDGGILRFHPDSIRLNPTIPEIVITKFEVGNQEVPFDDQRFAGKHSGSAGKNRGIQLNWRSNDISISFVALSYVSPQKNQYKYRLENYHSDWTYTDQQRPYATYTNLDPGKYTFTVTGSNNDGMWNDKGVSMSIIITPPIWWNLWSKSLYILGILSLLWFVRRYERKRTELGYALEVEKVRAEEMEEVNELKSHFFTNISHEIRTPLTLILGPVKELIDRNKNKDQKLLKVIQRNAYRLLDLMNQLLDISKIDAKAMPLQTFEMDVVAFIRSIFQIFNSSAESRDIKYTFTTNRQEIKLYFDPEKLEKILVNLLGNAFKFTADGEKIELLLTAMEKEICINVIDQGIGIPEEQRSKIFERFYQVDNSIGRAFEGSGVGLALVKELVELHHGTITASNNPEGGTIFSVKLPLGKDHLESAEIVVGGTNIITRSSIAGAMTFTEPELSAVLTYHDDLPLLMMVEDNQDMRTHLRNLLSAHYRIIELPDGVQALEIAQEKMPDLIVCDVMLPGLSGFEICQSLKVNMLTCHIPVILLTAKADQKSRIEGIVQGADAYLNKPFDKEELLTQIAQLLELRQKLQDHYQSNVSAKNEAEKEEEDIFLKALNSLIYENLDNPDLSIAQICRKMGVSRAQLYRKIKMLTNDSVANYISKIRLYKATALLKAKKLNVSEVAYSVGFRDPAYFSRLYKKVYGVSPSEV